MPMQMASPPGPMSVADVYDLAASIGKEFEKIIDGYGPETITQLMPRVIYALEHLEILSNRNEKENDELTELQYAVERLQADKSAKAEERDKYEKEIEQIEESWQTETKQLSTNMLRLEEDNRKMRGILLEQEGVNSREEEEEEAEQNKLSELIVQLRARTNQQQDELRSLNRDARQKSADFEALQSQLERLARMNADYRRKSAMARLQATHLLTEKAELQAELLDREKNVSEMSERMRERVSSSSGDASDSSQSQDSDVDMEKLQARLLLQGKMVVDLTDPERPRFTLSELRDVLSERNELKTRLIEVEDELKHYKPAPVDDEPFDLDAPVHGPINREPLEKLNPQKYHSESGIRRFFKFLVSPSSSRRKTRVNGGTSMQRR